MLQSSDCESDTTLVNKLIFTMNLMATTNDSDNKTKLIVFSSSSARLSGLMGNLQNNL